MCGIFGIRSRTDDCNFLLQELDCYKFDTHNNTTKQLVNKMLS